MENENYMLDRSKREENPILPETVSVLVNDNNGAKVYLVGTAHFSHQSQDDVRKVIQSTQPDVVVMELCRGRIDILQNDEETLLKEAKDLNLNKMLQVMKQSGVVQGGLHIFLLSLSAHVTKQIGMAPGGEFRAAFDESTSIEGCRIKLGDRPVQITLHRAFSRLSCFQKCKLVWHVFWSHDDVSPEEIEKCKQKDMLEQLLKEMTGEFPALSQVFIEERDRYLAHSLLEASNPMFDAHTNEVFVPKVVVGVVGMGHVPGIINNWQKPIDIKPLLIIPPESRLSRLFRYSLRYTFYLTLLYGVHRLLRWQSLDVFSLWHRFIKPFVTART